MKKKILLWSVVSILAAVVGGGLALWLWMPQTITLGDGTELTLLTVTYGKHHVLPKKYNSRTTARATPINTTNDSLCLWVLQTQAANSYPNFQMMAFDGANTACAASSTRRTFGNPSGKNGKEIMALTFDAFPRRGSKVYFRAHGYNSQEDSPTGQFSVGNPASGKTFPSWTPDTVPNTQKDDDVEVTLTKCEYDVEGFNNFGQDADPADPSTRGVSATFRIEQNGNLSDNWQPVQVETSDATGNHSRNQGLTSRRENDEEKLTYQWGLWPDEAAWKLRVELSQQGNFNREDVWTISDIPLAPGDLNSVFRMDRKAAAFAETAINQIQLGIFPAVKFNGNQRMGDLEGALRVHAAPAPEGFRLTIVKITDDQGKPVGFQNFGAGGTEYRFGLKDLGETKTINVTLALHRSRYVEFTVKPTKG